MIKKAQLEKLQLITDLNKPDKIYLCNVMDMFAESELTIPEGPKADFTGKCMAAVCMLMDIQAGDNKEITWEVAAGELTWKRKTIKPASELKKERFETAICEAYPSS